VCHANAECGVSLSVTFGATCLVATRARLRENDTQSFSNTLAPLRYPRGEAHMRLALALPRLPLRGSWLRSSLRGWLPCAKGAPRSGEGLLQSFRHLRCHLPLHKGGTREGSFTPRRGDLFFLLYSRFAARAAFSALRAPPSFSGSLLSLPRSLPSRRSSRPSAPSCRF